MTSIINKIKNYKMAIVDKYVLTQVVLATMICVVLFIIVWIAPETLLKVVRRLLTGEYNTYEAFRKLALETAKILANSKNCRLFRRSMPDFAEIPILRAKRDGICP